MLVQICLYWSHSCVNELQQALPHPNWFRLWQHNPAAAQKQHSSTAAAQNTSRGCMHVYVESMPDTNTIPKQRATQLHLLL
jgi:hypothetical protein